MSVKSLAQSSLTNSHSVNSMLSGYESNYFHHLETVRLSSTASSVTFSNLDRYKDFQHLQIRAVASHTNTGGNAIVLRLNNDSGSNYGYHEFTGNGSAVSSYGAASQNGMLAALALRQNLSNLSFGGGVIDILDAFDSDKNKTLRAFGGHASTESITILSSSVWLNTAAISSITLSAAGGNIGSGSRFSLYGFKARS